MNSFPWSARTAAFVVLCACVTVASASPQKQAPAKELPGGGNWMPTKMTPLQLATKLENRMAKLSSVSGFYQMRLKWVLGVVSPFNGKFEIKNPTTYRIDYLGTGKDEKQGAGQSTMVADGKRFKDIAFNGAMPVVPFAKRNLVPKKMMPEIGLHFDKWLFAPIGGGLKPFTKLVKELSQKESDYTLRAEEIHLEVRGKQVTNYRLHIERKPKIAKSVGAYFGEFVIDGHFWLPTSVRITDRRVKNPSTSIIAEARFAWNMKSGQKFKESRFAITK